MHTPSDIDWIKEARNREISQASEARWSVEGVMITSAPDYGIWLSKLKNFLSHLKLSQLAGELLQVRKIS